MTTKILEDSVAKEKGKADDSRMKSETHRREYWDRFCTENPSYQSCKIYDV